MIETISKQQKILTSARELFLNQGYEKTSMEEIARSIPMSKATLYNEFSNKEEILLNLCRNHCDQLNERLRIQLNQTESNYLATLKSMLIGFVQSIYAEASSVRTPEMLIFASTRLKETIMDRCEATHQIIRQTLEKAREAGEINEAANVSLLADVVVTALTPFIPPYPRALSKDGRPPIETLSKELGMLLDLLCEGLKNHKTS